MTTILLLRHGQSQANLNSLFVGQTDSPLSERGIAQAERTADYIVENYAVDRVYSSDLSRAFRTAKAVADRLGLEVTKVRDLREFHCGIWEGCVFQDMLARGEEFFRIWVTNIGRAESPGGESMAQLQKRGSEALLRIARENDGKTVVAAAHAVLIRAVMCLFEGKTLDEMKDVPWVNNASVTVLNYENGRMKVVSAGYDRHLEELRIEVPKNH